MNDDYLARAHELDLAAAKEAPIDDDCAPPERMYYLTMRALYKLYHIGAVSLDDAKAAKQEAVDLLTEQKYLHELYEHQARLEKVFRSEFDNEDNICKNGECRLYKLLCGIMDEDDVTEDEYNGEE